MSEFLSFTTHGRGPQGDSTMKKLLLICLALCVVFLMVAVASAADKDKAETVNGYVTGSKCGAKGAVAGKEDCTKECLESGAEMVVVTDQDQQVLAVCNPEPFKGHVGRPRGGSGHGGG